MEPELETKSGLYYADVKECPLTGIGKNTAKMSMLKDELYKISKEITQCGDFK